VFLTTWYQGFEAVPVTETEMSLWATVRELRELVYKELEALRTAGAIGSSLDAEVDLYCGSELATRLAPLADELRFVLICSEARLRPLGEAPPATSTDGRRVSESVQLGDAEVRIGVYPSSHPKCVRCWHHREDLGRDPRHPELCARCATNVGSVGETRRWA